MLQDGLQLESRGGLFGAFVVLIACLVALPVVARGPAEKSYAPFPEPGPGYVTDIAGLLSDQQEEAIEQRLWQVEEETGVEIVVVLIESLADYPGTPQGSIESFATGLFDAYGIGNLPENDGVLLLVARTDRDARIELGKGYGRHRDRDAAKIMQGNILPKFRKDNYAGGVEAGVNALMLEFAGVRYGVNWALVLMVASVPVLALVAYSLFKSGKRGWGWVVVGLLIVILLAILRVMLYALKNSGSSRGRSSGWSSGGFGGGFGGGSSGGGGASGSW